MKLLSLLLLFISLSQAQIISSPKYGYEKLNWGDKFSKVKNTFSITKFDVSEKTFNPFAKKRDDVFQYICTDSIHSEKVSIIFQFGTADSTLESIYILYVNINHNKEDEKGNETKKIEMTNLLTKHFSAEYQERSVPLVGTIRLWTLAKTYAQAYLLQFAVNIILTKR